MGFREFIRYRIEAGRRGFLGRAADVWTIAFHPTGISITHTDFRPFFPRGATQHEIAWSDVVRVFASQTDNFTWDTIWITFVLGNGTSVSVPEVAEGWERLIEQLPARLPDALPPQDWLTRVMRTAFACNPTQLYPAPDD